MPTRLVSASIYTLGLLFGFLGIIFYAALYITDSFSWTYLLIGVVVFNVIVWLIGPWFTALLHKWLYKMKFLTREEFRAQFPQLEAFMDKVCAEQKIKFPRVGFIEDDNPTAYTFGSAAFNARVILTRGLFTYLTPEETEAVVAHELGHIAHSDFIVMAVANTIIQLFYAIFRMFTGKGNKSGGDKKSSLEYVGLVAYVFYVIGTYIVLYLNRVRESYADEFSAHVTGRPADLSHALIKIGYGIVAKEETASSKALMENTATLGIMGFKSAKAAGLVAKTTNMEPNKVARVLLYDLLSPWAKLAGLVATHPLIGTRLQRLDRVATEIGQVPLFNMDQLVAEHAAEKPKIWSAFYANAAIYYLPVVLIIVLPVVILVTAAFVLPNASLSELVGVYILLLAFAQLVRVVHMFPNVDPLAKPTTMLELMSDLYASPAKGTPVRVEGQLMGRGVPGFVFSEDVMLQDNTGFMYLDYQSGIPVIGNIVFAWKKVQTLLGKPAHAQGWFFRSNSQHIALANLDVEGQVFKSYNRFWNYVWVGALAVLAGIFLSNQTQLFALWPAPLGLFAILYIIFARRNKIQSAAEKAEEEKQKGSGKRILKGVLIGVIILIIVVFIGVLLSN